MSFARAKAHLTTFGVQDRILEFPVSSATVALAAQAIGCVPGQIAKSMAFESDEGCLLVVAAGDVKIDNAKFKAAFGMKAKMLKFEMVEALTGHAVGGVCPFGLPQGTPVYLDESLKRFETVYPACGSGNSAIGISLTELEQFSGSTAWVDACKPMEQ